MNILKYIIGLTIIVMSLISCEDKLDISPRSSLSPDDITAKDAEAILTGCYDGVQGGGYRHFYLSYLTDDNSSDNLVWKRFWYQHQEIDDNDIQTNNSLISRWWSGYYVSINRANNLIGAIANVDEDTFMPSTRKNEILAEARFLRAWCYFNLVTRWGDIPLMLEGDPEEHPERDQAEKIWDQVETDLEYATEHAPEFKSSYTVSRQSSKALLARVYLYRNNKSEALTLAGELIGDNTFGLDSYSSVFDGSGSSREFLLQWRNTTNDPAYFGYWLVNRLELVLDPSLVEAFEEGDERMPVTVSTFMGQKVCGKYPNSGSGTDNWPVSRIAEMYLVAAEAAGYPEGTSYINTLRASRGLGSIAPSSEAEFTDILLHERRIELAVEGFRWYDLIRSGRAIDVLPNVTSANQLKYPIPQGERDVNPNLSQNDGY
ncbi:MAG: RagB/SusD family nutrient uptake outer membrane protein [Cytophagales bacterium]|nr:RagB/SusD family nutrient uptake outer membrane protein [Cytophagales bacterium]